MNSMWGVRCAVASVGHEVFGSGMSFGVCALAGRQGRGENRELRNSFQSCGTKNNGPAR